jgi:hypothetical protein
MSLRLLNKNQATEYFELKSGYMKELSILGHREIKKAVVGESFVLFRMNQEKKTKYETIKTFFVAGIFLEPDEDGVILEFEYEENGKWEVFEFSHTPKPVPGSGEGVFISVPSNVWISREVHVDDDTKVASELTSVAVMTKQRHKPDRDFNGVMRFMPTTEFWNIYKGNGNGRSI